jgi:hypothetical protein
VLQLLIYEHYRQVVALAKKFPELQEKHVFEVWLHVLQFFIFEQDKQELTLAKK